MCQEIWHTGRHVSGFRAQTLFLLLSVQTSGSVLYLERFQTCQTEESADSVPDRDISALIDFRTSHLSHWSSRRQDRGFNFPSFHCRVASLSDTFITVIRFTWCNAVTWYRGKIKSSAETLKQWQVRDQWNGCISTLRPPSSVNLLF